MSGFGDHEPDDAVDVSAPRADPEQVAIRFREARRELEDATLARWHELTDDQRAIAVAVVVRVRDRLAAEGTVLG